MDFKPDLLLLELHKDLSSYQLGANFAVDTLKRTILKKFVTKDANALLHTQALDSFNQRNENMSKLFIIPESRYELFFAWQARLNDVLMSGEWQSSRLSLNSCFLAGHAGPGSSRGTRHTNFVDKMFNSDLTYTADILLYHYQSALSPRWREAELIRSSAYSERKVPGSSLTTVPKDEGRNRCICTEPSLNMFYQLGAKNILNDLLRKHYYLDVRTQPDINKDLARRGSIDGSNATLDLKDASDSIHVDLCRQLLHPHVFGTLNVIRSQFYEDRGYVREFNMISSMGNGFTFSLMTLMLVSLLDVFLRTKNSRYVPLRDGVFGDDIILPSEHALDFSEVLSDFGFTVNLDKSFYEGPFRESCGGDFLHGLDVRGVYIKGINNEADVYSAFNRLHSWSIRHGVSLHHSLLYLKGLAKFRPVPLHEADDGGFKIPYSLTTNRRTNRNNSVIYNIIERCRRVRTVRDSERNHQGALTGFLGGYVRGQRITSRNNSDTLKVAKRITPNWDYTLNPEFNTRDFDISWLSLLSVAS